MRHTIRSLILLGAATATLGLAACSGDAGEIAGTSWGAAPGTQGEPSIAFDRDGSYSGNDGCNVIGGEWTADGDVVDLGNMRSTMMYCDGVDTWLSSAATATLGDGKLSFADGSGKSLGTLDVFDG